jgi:tetratricopeptide (TPR) repeat protein
MVAIRWLCVALLSGLLGWGVAGEAPPKPTPPTINPPTSATELLKQLPQVPSLVERDGAVWWQGPGPDGGPVAFKVVELDQAGGNPVIETEIGRLSVTLKLMADCQNQRVEALAVLPRLIAHAKSAALAGPDCLLAEGILTGIHLRSPKVETAETPVRVMVLPEGVLRKIEVPVNDRGDDRARLAAGVERLVQAVAATDLDEPGKKALADVLLRLPRNDGRTEASELAPSLARRVIRHGWLRPFFKADAAAATELEQVVAAAEQQQPVTLFEGPNLRLAEVKDAFGRGGWTLNTPGRAAYTQAHEEPLYYWALPDPRPQLVVELPPGSDPTSVNDQPVAARLYQGSQVIAAWSADQGFANGLRDEWRKVIPAKGRKGLDPNAVADFMPPHLLVTALNGDAVRLITAQGVLVPPRDATPDELERFLTEAAKILPDPAHLDLIGEYLLRLVYDSPDSRYPMLIGGKGSPDDRFDQTAAQTIATAAGGIMRGDCDDLAELYQTLAGRQGRNPHLIDLPLHAATAFTEKKEDGSWHTYLLQTGPPLEFIDAKLPASLEKAYQSFDAAGRFDANALGVLLRFPGEGTREPCRLSTRIFADPDYAKAMLDVQRDCHFRTYRRGIDKLKRLIAAGDSDNANYRALASLFGLTGQHPLAVEYLEEAIRKTEGAESRLGLSVELAGHLFDAGQNDRARQTVGEVLDRLLPELLRDPVTKDKAEQLQVQFGLDLADILIRHRAFDLATRTLAATQLNETVAMPAKIDQVGTWLASPRFNQKTWDTVPQLLQLRQLQRRFVTVAVTLLAGIGPDALGQDRDLQAITACVQDWLTRVAFRDLAAPADVLARYAIAGRYYAAILGEVPLDRLLETVPPPKTATADHFSRIGGLAQLQLDLPWIKLAVSWWSDRLADRFSPEHPALDREQILRLAGQVTAAHAACLRLGLGNAETEVEAHRAILAAALAAQDATTIRACLHYVKLQDNRRLRDDTALVLGETARFLPLEWWEAMVLRAWDEEVHDKPQYFAIAWGAARNGAPKHALKAAELATERFKNDPAFADECKDLKDLLATPLTVPKLPPPPAPPAPETRP